MFCRIRPGASGCPLLLSPRRAPTTRQLFTRVFLERILRSGSHGPLTFQQARLPVTSKKMVAVLLLLICSDAFAQQWCRSECTDALKEMKVSKVEIIGEEAVSKLVSDFCDEYSQSTITESALSAGGKYGGISAQMDQSKSTSEQLNKTYCASSDQSNASKQSYKLYLESISDRAYPAYQICLTGCQLGGLFVSELGGGDSERLLSVAFSPQNTADKEATVLGTGVNGVTCRWDG